MDAERLREQVRSRLAEQRALESEPHPPFDEFLTRYLELPPPPAHR